MLIKSTTKRGSAFVNAYRNSTNYTLPDCYGKYSTAKSRAEYTCRRLMAAENGSGFKILSFNTFGFTCGWETAYGLRIETPTNSYCVE